MPFTHEQFLDVFARYNSALWPAVVAIWLASAALVVRLLRTGRATSRSISTLLAIHWAWSGAVYHAAFFTSVNPAAWLFAAFFLLEAALLAWWGVLRQRLRFSLTRGLRGIAASAFLVYSLGYPILSFAGGLVFPRAPTFGVPCPTTLLTAGFLLAAEAPFPRPILVIPILWALVGGSAASLLHVPPDWALFAAALALAVRMLRTENRTTAGAAV